jgi:hypothetical protein
MLNLNRTPTWDRELHRVRTHRPFSSFGDLLGRFFLPVIRAKKCPLKHGRLYFYFYLNGQLSRGLLRPFQSLLLLLAALLGFSSSDSSNRHLGMVPKCEGQFKVIT